MWNMKFLEQIRTDGWVSGGKAVCPVGWASFILGALEQEMRVAWAGSSSLRESVGGGVLGP